MTTTPDTYGKENRMRISQSPPARGVLRVLVLLATLLGLAAPPAAPASATAAPF